VTVEIEGAAELRAALRRAVDATPAEFGRAMRRGSVRLRDRMAQLAPKRSGGLVASFKAYSTQRTAGVRSAHPGAGVQEFARQYKRTRGGKSHTVTMRNVGPAPRFGYRALDQLADQLADDAHEALIEVLSAHGWLEVVEV
jgi:hypothetical protein